MRTRLTKTFIAPLILTGALWLSPSVSVEAQQYGATTTITERDLDTFGAYLESNPSTARLLRDNPDLINDRRFVNQHKTLRRWLSSNPRIARKLENDPEAFFERLAEADETGTSASAEITAQDVLSFETYLNSDWQTSQLLYRDPELIRDRQFVRSHPELRNWLEDNPDAAEAIQANPHKFLWRQRASNPQDFLQQLFGRR